MLELGPIYFIWCQSWLDYCSHHLFTPLATLLVTRLVTLLVTLLLTPLATLLVTLLATLLVTPLISTTGHGIAPFTGHTTVTQLVILLI